MSRGDALVTEAPVEPEREAAPTGSEARALARAGASGVAWQSLAQVVSRVLTMIATVALARALSVEEYGLVAAALVIIGFVETVADAGVAQALVYLPKRAGLVRAAFAITVTTGVLLAIGVVLAAPVLAIAFGNPGIEPLVRALGIVVMLTALAAVPDALLRRELEFRRLTIAVMVRAALNAVVTLGLLVAGFGPWSLVWGTVAGAVAYLLACWFLAPPGSARELRERSRPATWPRPCVSGPRSPVISCSPGPHSTWTTSWSVPCWAVRHWVSTPSRSGSRRC